MVDEKSHVTDAEAQAVADFAVDVAQYLHLPRYKMLVMEEPCGEDCLASIDCVEGRWVAQIYLSPEWMEKSAEERMSTIVHEVCHLLHRGVDDVIDDTIPLVHSHEYASIRSAYRRATEYMVDHLAMFLSDHSTISDSWELHQKKTARKKS